jgi:hypothetical protein
MIDRTELRKDPQWKKIHIHGGFSKTSHYTLCGQYWYSNLLPEIIAEGEMCQRCLKIKNGAKVTVCEGIVTPD